MIATEAEHAGGAGARLGRIAVFGVLAVVVTACVLPALVIGYTAENKAPEEVRPRSMPAARGTIGPNDTSNIVASPVDSVAVPVSAATLKKVVYASATGGHFHHAGCSQLTADVEELTREEADSRGLLPCPSCGG